METVLCALSWSSRFWREPVARGAREKVLGSWVKEHRWGAEDWVFALQKPQLVKGKLYSYAQGEPSSERVAESGGRFNVFFYAERPDGHVGLVGAYRNALYVTKDDLPKRWKELKESGVARLRSEQVQRAFSHDPERGKAEAASYLREKPVRWIVNAEDVLVFEDMPAFPAPSWHPNNAHAARNLSDPAAASLLSALLYARDPSSVELVEAGFSLPPGPPEAAEEGRQRQRSHLVRERSSELAREYRAFRREEGPPPHYVCDACGESYVKALGEYALNVFDVHHQIPLGKAEKSKKITDPSELCMLCVRCHRVAHASERFTVKELRALLEGLA